MFLFNGGTTPKIYEKNPLTECISYFMPVGDVSLTLVVVTNSAFKGDIRLNGLPLIDYDPDLEWVIPRPHGM